MCSGRRDRSGGSQSWPSRRQAKRWSRACGGLPAGLARDLGGGRCVGRRPGAAPIATPHMTPPKPPMPSAVVRGDRRLDLCRPRRSRRRRCSAAQHRFFVATPAMFTASRNRATNRRRGVHPIAADPWRRSDVTQFMLAQAIAIREAQRRPRRAVVHGARRPRIRVCRRRSPILV